jgi:Flp pilus assembly protein TadG
MKAAFHRQETGAVLVQVALMMVVLLLFVGLAVDGGNAYFERRHMQNAADAGALAGARASATAATPSQQATDYAVTRNGADTALVEVIDNQVRVVASCTRETYFMGLAEPAWPGGDSRIQCQR